MSLSLCALQSPGKCLFEQLYLRLRAAPKSTGGENDGNSDGGEYALETKGREACFKHGDISEPQEGMGSTRGLNDTSHCHRGGHPISPRVVLTCPW